MPVRAGGRKDIMEHLLRWPRLSSRHLIGQPIAIAAGLAMLKQLNQRGTKHWSHDYRAASSLTELAQKHQVSFSTPSRQYV